MLKVNINSWSRHPDAMFSLDLSSYYDALKITHVIAFTCWMAGLFYLPRIFIYHTENFDKKEAISIFEVMEFKLYTYIMMPSLWITVISGLLLAVSIDAFSEIWFHVKILMVFLMAGYHFFLSFIRKRLILNVLPYSSRALRFINEIPTLLLIAIVILVIKKPL